MKTKKLITAFVLALFWMTGSSQQYFPNYTAGVAVDDKLYDFSHSSSGCSPDFDTYFSVYLNLSVSGLTFFLHVDSVENSVIIPPYGSIHAGDSLPLSALMNSYQFFMTYPGFVRLSLNVKGTPLDAHEVYSCGNISMMDAGMSCGNFQAISYDQTAEVKANTSFGGKLCYDNQQNTGLKPARIFLETLQGVVTDSCLTDKTGAFHFGNPTIGDYQLRVKTTIPWGGVNSADALLVKKNFVGLADFSSLQGKAADVNLSQYINSSDAFLISKRFVQISNSFPAGDWVFEAPMVSISEDPIPPLHLKALCTGDLDGSYIPFVQSFERCGDTLTDPRDMQKYPTVQIGTQCWMKKNLNIGTMVNSTYIANSSHTECSNNGVIEKYCYNNDPAFCDIYGGLYDWNEMMQYDSVAGIQGICPIGWHIPTDGEWCTLTSYLDPTVDCTVWASSGINAGGKLKEVGTTHWSLPNKGATNQSGFTALGSGSRLPDGTIITLMVANGFWSSSEQLSFSAVSWGLSRSNAKVYRNNLTKLNGYSVRCVKNNPITPGSSNLIHQDKGK